MDKKNREKNKVQINEEKYAMRRDKKGKKREVKRWEGNGTERKGREEKKLK